MSEAVNGVESEREPAARERLAGFEIEVKFATDAAGLARVLAAPMLATAPAWRSEKLRSVYFDTAEGDLRRAGLTLRIRKSGRSAPVLGFKAKLAAAKGSFARSEVEVRSRGLRPDLALFDKGLAEDLARLIGKRPLQAQFETQITRRLLMVDWGRSRIEIACDDGAIVADTRRTTIAEVELELKSGEEGDLYAFATTLAEALSLKLAVVSKAEQGFQLIAPEPPEAVKALAIACDPDGALDDAVPLVLAQTLAPFVANWAVLRASDRPEAIHQMRVALRRLRAALGLFSRALPCPAFDALRSQAGAIARRLGPARACDVFQRAALQGPLAHPDRPEQAQKLLALVAQQRADAYAEARALIDEAATSVFVLELHGALAHRVWRNGVTAQELALLTSPPADFARASLDRLLKRALKRGRTLPDLSDEARHELRIALKTLRYATEFFGTLFGHRRAARRFTSALARLQDLLGAHNDVVEARRFLASLPPELDQAAGFVLGWQARGAALADAELLDAWRRFRTRDPFWR